MNTSMTTGRPRNLLSSLRREPLHSLREEMEDLMTRFWGGNDEGWFGGGLSPSVDLSETDKTVDVRMDLPGVKPEEIDIKVHNNMLTVSGERKEEHEEKDRMFHRVERRTGSFSRTFTLPSAVSEDEVAAEYHDGVLSITLPKTEEAKVRKIPVKG